MHSIHHSILVMRSWICIATVVIALRLVHLQVILEQELKQKSERNFLRWHNTMALRGDIVDTHGALLVTNRPVIDLCWQPAQQRTPKDEIITTLLELADLTQRPALHDQELIKHITYAEKTGNSVCIARDIDFQTLVKIKERYANHPTITTTNRFTRYYPQNLVACHLVGYLSTVEPEFSGKMGLEKLLNDALKGENGQVLSVINATGKHMQQLAVRETQQGKTVRTTIDLTLQSLVETVFGQELSGSFIIMDPSTGALRALVSRPAFDPSMFLRSITQQQWTELQSRRPFINRALDAAYPPGSIFKLVTISAALENGYIDRDSHWYCHGYSTFCDRRYYCNKKQGHGRMSVLEAVAHSCNPLFYELGKQMDIDLLATYAHTFGLGEATGIALSENAGLVPTRAWKRKTKGESWWQGETLSAAIGQSFLLATPVQVARMVAGIFTGYLVKPRILEEEAIEKKPLKLQSSTIDFLRTSMRSVVLTGSGRQVSRIQDMEIYAKTATAQTSALERREDGLRYKEHGWFVCHIRYKNTEPLVMVVVLENIGSSQAAVGLARKFLLLYKTAIDEKGHDSKGLVGLHL